MTATDVEGFTAEDPIEDLDDWLDIVRWQVNYQWSERKHHDRDAFLCYSAGDPECLALGHKPDVAGEWHSDDDWGHELGWDGAPICPATRYAVACSQCESEDCEWQPFDASSLWKAVAA